MSECLSSEERQIKLLALLSRQGRLCVAAVVGQFGVSETTVRRFFYRFLETIDKHFNYSVDEIPQQGRWHIHGLYLPDEVLKKVYFNNTAKRFGIGKIP